MNPPTPTLLRTLRTSLSSQSPLITRSTPSIQHLRTSFRPQATTNHQPIRLNSSGSNIARPSRIVPRHHQLKPNNADRGPPSTEDTQTDFSSLNVLGSIPAPTTAIDETLDSGFLLNSGVRTRNGDGVLLVGGECFTWRPWLGSSNGNGNTDKEELKKKMVNKKGQFEVDESVWGLLGVVWPRPDLLIVGTGAMIKPLSLETRKHINSHGVRVEVLDTRNAAAQFNMLATERGVSEIAAALIPIGFDAR